MMKKTIFYIALFSFGQVAFGQKHLSLQDTLKSYFDEIRYHVDKLELLVDDEFWELPKYREMLFLR